MGPMVALSLALLAAPAPVRLMALGDSFTIGTGSAPEQSFPQRLAARWRTQGKAVEVDDPAVNGYSTRELIDRELPELRSFKPTLVTVAIGANDLVRGRALPAFRENLRAIFKAIREAGVPADRIWVI